jgi:serine/threonine-protein kinase RsbW
MSSTNDMSRAEEFLFNIPSETAAGLKVQETIIQKLQERGFSERDIFGVRLALEEALVNAIKHGNRSDLSKQVRVEGWVDSTMLRVEIEDEGPGFQVNDVPDPTADENLERPSGRGIMLMQAFMSKIEYNEQGNCVILEKAREAATGDPA